MPVRSQEKPTVVHLRSRQRVQQLGRTKQLSSSSNNGGADAFWGSLDQAEFEAQDPSANPIRPRRVKQLSSSSTGSRRIKQLSSSSKRNDDGFWNDEGESKPENTFRIKKKSGLWKRFFGGTTD